VAVLFGALAERRRVQFSYRGESRQVDPWRLAFRAGHWYLFGHDHRRGGSRTFRVDRLQSEPEPVGDAGSFDRPAGAAGGPPPPWLLGDEDEAVASLLVDAAQAHWAVAAAGPESVQERRPDGSAVLAIRVTNRAGFRSFVLGFLDHAELLGPPELRAELVGWLETVAGAA
jgi:predicted DNA-binding transcriptional regulator YafY